MDMNQCSAGSLQGRALSVLMGVDRIFLCRQLFVALAIILVLTGMVFAQLPVKPRTPTNQNTLQPSGAGESSNVAADKTIVGETKALGKGQVRSWVSLDKNGKPTAIGLTFSENALWTLPAEPPP